MKQKTHRKQVYFKNVPLHELSIIIGEILDLMIL